MHQFLATVLDSPFSQTQEFASQALAGFKAGDEAATLGKLFATFGAPDNADWPLDDILPAIKAATLVAWGASTACSRPRPPKSLLRVPRAHARC